MQQKLIAITLAFVTIFMVTIQHHAKTVREAVNPQQELPILTVNINTATVEEIAEVLIGIGVSKANEIVTFRKANGPFKSIDELTQVKGIGVKTIEKNRDKITF